MRLKGEEDRAPAVVIPVFKQESTIPPGTIVGAVFVPVALVHMHVVQTIAGLKVKDVVCLPNLWAPARAEGVQAHGGIGDGLIDAQGQRINEVIARPRAAGRDAAHLAAVEHAAALVVEGQAARFVGHQLETVLYLRQMLRDLVAKMVVRPIEKVGMALCASAGAGVDSDAKLRTGGIEVNVEVRGAAAWFGAQAKHAARDQGVGFCHARSVCLANAP